ncbi:hypothetical protein JAAARDRAFT_29169 [Jaapia argillacea MUCL 33604]|uniref:N-acetyltransferase domain-containing protein n=1 Tax=Jaapia argillacea MUCL 33604 TaxID=933084 RepID=A0A067Q7Z0_9AGAM|nr:hypothetical protein JAAARDRAFT_29169 [Jaapia argillacea MUCL 33604]
MDTGTSPRHLHPLQVNPTSGEPYLRLPSPHTNIIITPPRPTDVEAMVELMGDSRVWLQLASVPHPYLSRHAEVWLGGVKETSDSVLRELEEGFQNGGGTELPFVGGCPVRSLREVKEDGEEVFIGDCTIIRGRDVEIGAEAAKASAEKQVGDPEIIWAIGDYLASSHHGKGIMTVAVRTMIQDWAIPRMNAHRIRVSICKGNIGSVRVFEKNGFQLIGTKKDCLTLTAEGREGGPPISLDDLEWCRENV